MSFGKLASAGCLVLFGLIFVIAGSALALIVPGMMNAEADRIEQLQPLSAASLEDSAPGRPALIEGRISDRNRPRFENLVAYLFEVQRRDSEGDVEWRTQDRVTPALIIDLPDGRIQIAEGYNLNNIPSANTIRNNDERFRGFIVGDDVVIVGSVIPGVELPELDAEFMAGGSQADYVENQRTGASVAVIAGIIFAVVGLFIVIGGGFAMLRAIL